MKSKRQEFFVAAPGTVQQSQEQARIEKEFVKIINFQRKQANNLLGVFSEKGYDISDELKAELIAVPKKFDRIENNVMYAATRLGEFVLNFKIEMEMGGSFCEATLNIIEIEQGIEEDVKHTTFLAKILEPYSLDFRDKISEVWHIFYSNEMKEKNDVIYQYLHMQNEEFMFNRDPMEFLAHLYMVRMQELLENMGARGNDVKNKYAELLQNYINRNGGVVPDDTMKKRILDQALILTDVLGYVLQTEDGAKLVGGINTSIIEIQEKKNPPTINDVSPKKNEEKKQEKEPAQKPKAKTSSAKPAKPAAKSDAAPASTKPKEVTLNYEDHGSINKHVTPIPQIIPPHNVVVEIRRNILPQQPTQQPRTHTPAGRQGNVNSGRTVDLNDMAGKWGEEIVKGTSGRWREGKNVPPATKNKNDGRDLVR